MTKRLNILASKNGGIEGLVAVEAWIAKSFDPKLMELVKVRVSQINGCANCLHMHRQDALKLGETEERMLLLNAWHESELYADRERAALTWAEALTNVAEGHAPDSDYEVAQNAFSKDELVALSIGIAMINAWNRLAIGLVIPVSSLANIGRGELPVLFGLGEAAHEPFFLFLVRDVQIELEDDHALARQIGKHGVVWDLATTQRHFWITTAGSYSRPAYN